MINITLANEDIRQFEKPDRKIRDAETLKIPYMLIMGEKEIDHKQVTIRKHKQGEIRYCDSGRIYTML